ncbi:hypothetical protein [Streptomyces sp. SM13]|uniref:hypothetical protein n=1 Tax=Streptomyces sp. SM13 TaxID=1983803 RepID=UPI0015E191DD|nr:hypothetical protein [Streptomyces sp. SM13]
MADTYPGILSVPTGTCVRIAWATLIAWTGPYQDDDELPPEIAHSVDREDETAQVFAGPEEWAAPNRAFPVVLWGPAGPGRTELALRSVRTWYARTGGRVLTPTSTGSGRNHARPADRSARPAVSASGAARRRAGPT